MKVLTIYANPNPKSFCHAVLEKFSQGLKDGGHENEVVDLYAIGFDPVLTNKDMANWLPDENSPAVVEAIVNRIKSDDDVGIVQRISKWLLLRNRTPMQVINFLKKRGPKDVKEQQAKVAAADALVFISPVWFVGFPAIMKGWIERVFSLDFAFRLSSEGWHGDIKGRIPQLRHEKALIINTTIFNEEAYAAGLKDAMHKLIDEFALRYPSIRTVEHEYFHAVNMADEQTLRGYLEKAYLLGKEFGNEHFSSVEDSLVSENAEMVI